MVYVYTIDCPACRVLEKKLTQKNVEFIRVTSELAFEKKKIKSFPMMQVDGGPLMTYAEAVKYVNGL